MCSLSFFERCSGLEGAVNSSREEYVTVAELGRTVIGVSGIGIEYVEGPVGVRSRNFAKSWIKSLGWEARVSLREGLEHTYVWIKKRVKAVQFSSP